MSTIGERITAAREKAELSKAELARRVGMSRAGIGQLELGGSNAPTPENLYAIADVLAVNPRWLATGKGPRDRDGKVTDDNRLSLDGGVPFMTWQALRKGGPAGEPVLCPQPHSDEAFAVRVEDDAMVPLQGKGYPEGSIIYVDPKAPTGPGKRAIVRLKKSGVVLFRQLAEDAGRPFLRALNPNYPPTFEPFEIIGKVIGKWEPEE